MTVVIRHTRQNWTPPPVTWPKLSDTGPIGTLTPWTGSNDFSTNGVTIENALFSGQIGLYGANITFRNCKFQNFSGWGILHQKDSTISYNCSLEYCHFDGGGAPGTTAIGIGQGGGHVIGCNIEGSTLGINCFGPLRVEGNYIHNLWSSSTNPDARHFDGVAIFGHGGQIVRNNAITMPAPDGGTACVFCKPVDGNIPNVLIENNLLQGKCSYQVYIQDYLSYTTTGVTIKDNCIEYADSGWIGEDCLQNPTEINNTQWNPKPPDNNPRPPAVLIWDAKT